jgi:hypothetical protein
MLDAEDTREVMGSVSRTGASPCMSETLIEAADRVWYATPKEG